MERKISRKLVNRFGLPNRIGTNQNNNDTNSNINNVINNVINNAIKEENIMEEHYPLFTDYENDYNKHTIEIGFLIVATGKYDIFLRPLIDSIEKYILPDNKKHYNIFTDKTELDLGISNYSIFPIEHRPFPYPTLNRFHFFDQYLDQIKGDQLAYIDADTLITDKIGTEIITPITATQHCGYVNKWGTFEPRMESKCFVNRFEGKNYYGGGFYSFERNQFLKMVKECKEMVDFESLRGRIPVWHDESVINKYLTTNRPTRVLSPSYHFPESNQSIYESWGGKNKFPCKILLLDKDHKEIRS
jgi:hypothetical protein